VDKVADIHSEQEVAKAIRTTIAAKQYGNEDFLSKLIAKAVLTVMPKNPAAFNVDNIRIVKIMGGGLEDSDVVKGMVFSREPSGAIKKAKHAKVAVFSCPVDIGETETKGTVLLHNAKEMLEFSKGEEVQLEKVIVSL
jgi:T-complex protein 1 subunit theta